jgi:lipooligosaccharide transport system permease protein
MSVEPTRTSTDELSYRDQALAAAVRPRRFGAWYVAEHRLRSMRAYGGTIVIGGIGQPVLYLLGIGLGLAAFLDQPIASGAHGPVSYLWFVAPALMASATITVALDEFTYAVLEGFKWRRLFWAMNASPVSPQQIATGMVIAVIGRMAFVAIAYGVLVVLFGASGSVLGALLTPLVAVLGGLAFGLPLLAYSASIKNETGQFAVVQRFIFTPLFLFSGTFYPLATLPIWLQPIGWVSPLWHAAEIGRTLSYGSPPGAWPVWAHLLVLLVMAAVGWAVGRRIFVARLR